MRTASGAVLSIVLGLCLGLGLAVFQECADSMPPLFAAQAPKPAPPVVSTESRAASPASVLLTHEEGLEIELNSEKMNNLNLQAERIERQISEARKGLSQDRDDLTAKFAKAHGLDPAKYRLDPQAKAFLPVPAPPAAATKGGNQK